ncbi:prolipoprotein diacylglyceryl transferase [Thermodesulfobacteriota bacterium]
MLPDLFSIGPVTLHTYGLFVALGCIAGILTAVHIGKSKGITAQQVMDMGFIIVLWGIIGSRLAYVFMNFSYYISHPLYIFKIWQGGLVFSGGLVAVLIALAWYIRRQDLSFWQVGDLWSPAASLGQGLGRIGCLMAGCCYGKPTNLFWGITFSNSECLAPVNISLHPTQIYSSLSGFIIFAVLLTIHKRKSFKGQVLIWFLILHSTSRLLIERFRGDDRGLLAGSEWTMTQAGASIILFAAIITLFIIKSRQEKRASKSGE